MTIRLALADDHPLILDGLARLLGREPDLEVVARCPDGEAALRAVAERRPDVLVLDLRMPRLGGLEVLRRLARQKSATRVVVLAGEVGEAELLEAVRLGLAEGTVKMHLVRVYGKLGVTNRVELANRLRREGD